MPLPGLWPGCEHSPTPPCISADQSPTAASLPQAHTVPTKTTGHCGSVSMRLIPAPRGAGIVAARTPKKARPHQLLAGLPPVIPQLMLPSSCRCSNWGLLQCPPPPPRPHPAYPCPLLRLQVLQMAGIEDCYTASAGNTKTLGNTVRATFYALAVRPLNFLVQGRWRWRSLQAAAEQGRVQRAVPARAAHKQVDPGAGRPAMGVLI